MYYDNAVNALKRYRKHHNVERLFKETYALEFERPQQQRLAEILAQPMVSYNLKGMPNVTGEEAFALEVAWEGTNLTHFRYAKTQGAPAQQGPIGSILGNLFTFPRSWGQRILKQVTKLRPGSGATFNEKLIATKVVAGIIIISFLIGEGFRRITGRKFNPYDPMNILSWTPGGLVLGTTAEIGNMLYNLGQAAFGDKSYQGAVLSSIPRLAGLMMPLYDMFVNILESATDTKNIDYYFLNKVRELLDSEYTARGGQNVIERDWVAWIQHALFRGEMPEYEMPDNPEVVRLREEYRDLFLLYDDYADPMSGDYIEEEKDRREARQELLHNNTDFADAKRTIEFYDLGYWDEKAMKAFESTAWWKKYIQDIPLIGEMYGQPNALDLETELLNQYLEYGHKVDEFGSNSAEAILYRYDHSDLQSFGSLHDEDGKPLTFGWQEQELTDQEVKRYRLIVKDRKLIDWRDGWSDRTSDIYIKDDDERKAVLQALRGERTDENVEALKNVGLNDAEINEIYSSNTDFLDNERRIKALENDVPSDDIMEEFVEYSQKVDEFGGSSAEARLFRLDHSGLSAWGQLNDVFGWVEIPEEDRRKLELQVNFSKDFDDYDAIADKAGLSNDDKTQERQDMLFTEDETSRFGIVLTDFGKAYYTKDAYEEGYSESQWDKHLEFQEIPEWGSWRDRWLVDPDNSLYAAEYYNEDIGGHVPVHPDDIANIKPEMYDQLYLDFKDDFEAFDDISYDSTLNAKQKEEERIQSLLGKRDFGVAYYKREAYENGLHNVNEDVLDDYAGWFLGIKDTLKKPEGWRFDFWFADDWWLMAHPDFEDAMVQLYQDSNGKHGWKEHSDFSKVPSRHVLELFFEYDLITSPSGRLQFRIDHPELDAWGQIYFDWQPAAGREDEVKRVEGWPEHATDLIELKARLEELERIVQSASIYPPE